MATMANDEIDKLVTDLNNDSVKMNDKLGTVRCKRGYQRRWFVQVYDDPETFLSSIKRPKRHRKKSKKVVIPRKLEERNPWRAEITTSHRSSDELPLDLSIHKTISEAESLQSQECEPWDIDFSKSPKQCDMRPENLNDEELGDIWDIAHLFTQCIVYNKKLTTALNQKRVCACEEQKTFIQILYESADSFMSPEEIKTHLELNYGSFLSKN